ncbi:AAA family ATPase [bacterium]|nr:AAA family ATPase [bacterium]
MEKLKERVTKLIEHLNSGIHERNEIIAVSFLAALSDQNVFLFGPPGTAKSLIARRLSHAFKTHAYFEYLMQRFSTPEEVFGPVSISELKQDNFLRKTEGFLPQSDFAFLDEIWKSSPAILNTLLTIINEKIFRNGTKIEPVPLKALIAASNETPPPGQGLEALYDRFLIRLNVPPMEEKGNFESLLQSKPTTAQLELPEGYAINHKEWEKWCEEIHSVELSEETKNVIHNIRLTFEEHGEKLDVYVSDRRWQKAAILIKAAAFFCGRKKTNLVDTLLLRHCLWTTKENHGEVTKIVENAVRKSGFETGFSLHSIDSEKENLEKEINKELYYSKDVYETVNLNGNTQYFEFSSKYKNDQKQVTFFIKANLIKHKDKFSPVDEQGNDIKWIECNFDNQGTCAIKIAEDEDNQEPYKNIKLTPRVLFHKGDKKSDVNKRLIESLQEAVLEINVKIEEIINQIEDKLAKFREELNTPFIPDNIRDIALESIEKQLHDLKLRLKDCDRLESLIG